MDASKAPGYRGNNVSSPVSSKTSSNSTTPPSLPLAPGSYQGAGVFSAEQCVPHSSGPVMTMAAKQPPVQASHSGLAVTRPVSSNNTLDMHSNSANSGTNLNVGVVGQQSTSHMDVSGGPMAPSPFGNRAVFQGGELPPRTVSAQQQHSIMVSSSQSTLDPGALYTPVSTPGYGPDHQSHNAALLKMVPGGELQSVPPQQPPQPPPQQQQQHPMLSSYHHQHHPMNYSQPKPNIGVSSSQVNLNTTVSTSRLNPSAPDFSLHLANKPQQQQQQPQQQQQVQPPPPPPQQQQPQQQQQQPPPPPPPQQQPQLQQQSGGGNMFNATSFHQRASVLPPTQPSSLQTSASALGTMLPNISFPLGKSSIGPYHHQPLPTGPAPGPATNMTANGQRWPVFPPAYHHPHHPHAQPDVMSQMNFSGTMAHIANLAATLAHPGNGGAAELLAGLENGAIVGGGNSPAMSPSSPASGNTVSAGEPGHHKLEDRKIPPRPIGIERNSWKNNYGNISGVGAGGDLEGPNWMLSAGEPKMPISSWVNAGMSHTVERHQIYRANASHYGRMAPSDELPQMLDTSFQVYTNLMFGGMMYAHALP